MVLFKLPLFFHTPKDWDEGVYLFLAEKMTWSLGNYTLKGSVFEKELLHPLYSSPIFHHPPLIPYSIKILSLFTSPLAAAKIINFTFVVASCYLLYRIALMLTDEKGALLAVFLWVLCPVFNLESTLVHLDLASTVFVLGGIWAFLRYRQNDRKRTFLYLSALLFALAMLTKYTAPVYGIIPFFFFMADKTWQKNKLAVTVFGTIIAIGFSWHLYIAARFGSLLPVEFVGNNPLQHAFTSPYLKIISKRQWFHVWFYFLCICPLFILYLGAAIRCFVSLVKKKQWLSTLSTKTTNLLLINVSLITCVILFNIINLFTNGYWILRHNMPFFPAVYMTLGVISSTLIDRGNKRLNSFLLTIIFVTIVSMSASSFITVLNQTSLRPVPPIFFWVPGFEPYFH